MSEGTTGGPTEQDIFGKVYELVMLGIMRDRESAESLADAPPGTASTAYVKEEENDAIQYLLGQHHDAVADAYVELVRRYVELEYQNERLQREIDELKGDS